MGSQRKCTCVLPVASKPQHTHIHFTVGFSRHHSAGPRLPAGRVYAKVPSQHGNLVDGVVDSMFGAVSAVHDHSSWLALRVLERLLQSYPSLCKRQEGEHLV